ncbi:MAG: hypothetical protein V3V01_09680 [Acidimicrobiales bacterium]
MSDKSAQSLLDRFAGPGASLVGAVLWLGLALRTPTSTFHFAPLIVAGVWPVVRRSMGRRLETVEAAKVAVASGGLALLVGLTLLIADSLKGPSLWSEDDAFLEVVLFAILGAAFGFRVASRSRPGLLF